MNDSDRTAQPRRLLLATDLVRYAQEPALLRQLPCDTLVVPAAED